MAKNGKFLSLLFAMVMVVACGGNNASSKESSSSSNVSTSTSTPTPTISTSSSRNPYDDFETPVENSFSYESLAVTDERDFLSLAGETWKFHRGAVSGAEKSTFNDKNWENVIIPHTWNKIDGQDGGGNYWRGESWYHHRVILGTDFLKDK